MLFVVTGSAWVEYGEPTVDDDALGIDGAEADENNDGATSECG